MTLKKKRLTMQKTLFDLEEFDEKKLLKNPTTKNVFDEMQTLIEKKESLAKHRKRKVKYG